MKAKKILALAGAAALIVPAASQAHVSLQPNTIPAGAFATLDVRVPGEQEGAYVKKVDVLFPAGFTSVDYENVPGWTIKVINQRLVTPIQTDEGPVDEDVSQIVWTWTGPLGQVRENQFIQFPLSVAIPDNTVGQALLFKTVQTYSNGQVVHWIDSSLAAEHPAPRVDITAKGGVIEDLAGKEAGPEAGQPAARPVGGKQAAPASSGGGASRGLGIAALALAALGLLTGLAAIGYARRLRSGSDV